MNGDGWGKMIEGSDYWVVVFGTVGIFGEPIVTFVSIILGKTVENDKVKTMLKHYAQAGFRRPKVVIIDRIKWKDAFKKAFDLNEDAI